MRLAAAHANLMSALTPDQKHICSVETLGLGSDVTARPAPHEFVCKTWAADPNRIMACPHVDMP
jgi:hypothetical protein